MAFLPLIRVNIITQPVFKSFVTRSGCVLSRASWAKDQKRKIFKICPGPDIKFIQNI